MSNQMVSHEDDFKREWGDCVRFMNQRQLTDYVDLDSTKVGFQLFLN